MEQTQQIRRFSRNLHPAHPNYAWYSRVHPVWLPIQPRLHAIPYATRS